jgi:hypothetical protein
MTRCSAVITRSGASRECGSRARVFVGAIGFCGHHAKLAQETGGSAPSRPRRAHARRPQAPNQVEGVQAVVTTYWRRERPRDARLPKE